MDQTVLPHIDAVRRHTASHPYDIQVRSRLGVPQGMRRAQTVYPQIHSRFMPRRDRCFVILCVGMVWAPGMYLRGYPRQKLRGYDIWAWQISSSLQVP